MPAGRLDGWQSTGSQPLAAESLTNAANVSTAIAARIRADIPRFWPTSRDFHEIAVTFGRIGI